MSYFNKIVHNKKGYSFIEVLIAMFIFSFVSLSILRIYLVSISGEINNKTYYFAVKLADEKMKYITKQNKLKLIKNKTTIINEFINYKINDTLQINYNRITSIEKSTVETLHIKIFLFWKNRGKKEKYELETYI